MIATLVIYRLEAVHEAHLVLRAPTGALRVVGVQGLQAGQPTPQGVCFGTPQTRYLVSPEDYLLIKPLICSAG